MTKYWMMTGAVAALLAAAPAFAQTNGHNTNLNAPGATASASKPSPATLTDQDRNFLKMASEDNVTAMRLGQLATQKATNPSVKQLAQHIATDQSQAQQSLARIAKQEKMVPPDHVKSSAVGNYDNLWAQNGRDFNTGYVQQVVSNQQDFVGTFQNEIKNGNNQALKSYAKQELPTLKHQLGEAQNLNQQLSNKNG